MSAPFLAGVNLPWIRYGCDFGANAWQPEGGLAGPGRAEAAREALRAVADSGASAVRWFLLCDGRAGLAVGADASIRPDGRLFADLDTALRLLDDVHLSALFVLTDFKWFSRRRLVDDVQLGGRSNLILAASRRTHLLERVFAPILGRYGNERTILGWDIINEPDWVVTRSLRLRPRAMTRPILREFVGETTALIHALTRQAATVGSARPRTLPLLHGLGLDFYQVHWYDKWRCRFPLDRPVSALGADKPVVLGEFPTCRSGVAPAAILETARAQGYAGAFAWSACATDRYSNADALYRAVRCRPGL